MRDRPKIIWVIAGSYTQFVDFCQSRNKIMAQKEVRPMYADSPVRVKGVRNQPYVVVGSGRHREDYAKIVQEMLICGNFKIDSDNLRIEASQ
jgi:ribosome-associated toxin RatA of RatAB toxin-antitoxin module